MAQRPQVAFNGCRKAETVSITRRAAVGASIAATLGALSGRAFGQQDFPAGLPQDIRERMEKSREFSERMRNAASPEERNKVMEERNAWERSRAIEDLQRQLEVSDQEWSVIKPRLEVVYNLVHPQFARGRNPRAANPVDRSRGELRETLNNKNAPADQIKAKLTAFRSAQEQNRQELAKARQNLLQILTLRQEALLVLNGLLD